MYRFKPKTIVVLVLLCLSMVGCQTHRLKQLYTFPYYEATIDDLPPTDEIRGVIVTGLAPIHRYADLFLIGNQAELEILLGHKLYAKYTLDDREILERIVMYFRNAERNDEIRDGRYDVTATFITDKQGYVIWLTQQGDFAVGSNWQSERLSGLFNEIEYKAEQKRLKELETRQQSQPQVVPDLTLPFDPWER